MFLYGQTTLLALECLLLYLLLGGIGARGDVGLSHGLVGNCLLGLLGSCLTIELVRGFGLPKGILLYVCGSSYL